MNILFAPIYYLPHLSGVPIHVHSLATSLVRKGHSVVVVTPKLEPAHPSFEVIDGIEVYRMPFVFPWRVLWQQPEEGFLPFCRHAITDLKRLIRLMADKDIEIVDIHSLTGPHIPYLLFAQRLAGVPLVACLHGNEFFRLDTRNTRMRRFLLRHSLRRAEQVTAVSSQVADEAGRFCPEVSEKIVTIPNGVVVEEFDGDGGFPFFSPYLLSVARLSIRKGHDVLLSAFQKVAEREKDIRLIIVGDGPERIRLHAITLALGLKDRVTFLGEVDHERVKALLAGCEFLVLSSWSEGIPLVALEAMASRRPVVSTDVGGVPEVVSHSETGFLVPPGDPDALADAMLSLVQNRDQCRAMGEKGRAFVEAHHGYAKTVDRYLDVYREVLAEGPVGREGQERQP